MGELIHIQDHLLLKGLELNPDMIIQVRFDDCLIDMPIKRAFDRGLFNQIELPPQLKDS